MKRTITLIAILASSTLAAFGAKATENFRFVDMSKLYAEYSKAKEAQESFAKSIQQAQQKIAQMQQEGLALGKDLESLQAKANNDALTDDAKAKFRAEAEAKAREIQGKYVEINQFKQQTDQALAQRQQSVVDLHMKEIREATAKVAKSEGVTKVFNKTTAIVWADESYDITDKVLPVLNGKSK